jgi:hypothetical protein
MAGPATYAHPATPARIAQAPFGKGNRTEADAPLGIVGAKSRADPDEWIPPLIGALGGCANPRW